MHPFTQWPERCQPMFRCPDFLRDPHHYPRDPHHHPQLHDAGVSVFVAQGTADEVIASEVPAAIGSVFPSGVIAMEGHGHRGHPTDPEAEFLPEACAAAGGWLGSLACKPQSKL